MQRPIEFSEGDQAREPVYVTVDDETIIAPSHMAETYHWAIATLDALNQYKSKQLLKG